MGSLYVPFRYDYVGSFMRPEKLKKAKADFEAGNLSGEALTATQDEAIRELVEKIKNAGYHVLTDGEFRRTYWHLDFMWGFEGIGHKNTGGSVAFHDEPAMLEDTYLTGKISAKPHPFVEHFKFMKQFEDDSYVVKQTIPAPAQLFSN